MDAFDGIFRFFITFFIFKTILNLFLRTKFIREESLEEDTVANIADENKKEMVVDMVYDEICEKYIPQNKAYHIIENDKTHYFCSWECREKYIKSK
mgnify:CR=1 FL=1